jgi:hypothetical protein
MAIEVGIIFVWKGVKNIYTIKSKLIKQSFRCLCKIYSYSE